MSYRLSKSKSRVNQYSTPLHRNNLAIRMAVLGASRTVEQETINYRWLLQYSKKTSGHSKYQQFVQCKLLQGSRARMTQVQFHEYRKQQLRKPSLVDVRSAMWLRRMPAERRGRPGRLSLSSATIFSTERNTIISPLRTRCVRNWLLDIVLKAPQQRSLTWR